MRVWVWAFRRVTQYRSDVSYEINDRGILNFG